MIEYSIVKYTLILDLILELYINLEINIYIIKINL